MWNCLPTLKGHVKVGPVTILYAYYWKYSDLTVEVALHRVYPFD